MPAAARAAVAGSTPDTLIVSSVQLQATTDKTLQNVTYLTSKV